ncbi:MAG: hypothetical protein WC805_00175 [Patescibacteria group bacterium]|jgi:hypothetical protein
MRQKHFLFAGIILAVMMLLSISCGGGGSTVMPQTIPPVDLVTAWRMELVDTNFQPGGRSVYESMTYDEKIIDIYPGEIRNLRFQIQGMVDGSWFLYSGLDTARLDVRQAGIESGGGQPPMLASSPPQNVAFLTSLVWPVTIYSGTGKISFVAEAYDEDPTNSDTGVLCYLHFRLRLNAGSTPPPPPPPAKTCDELHPDGPEVINGHLWKCQNNIWTDTGPVPPPAGQDLYPLDGTPQFHYGGTSQQGSKIELVQPIPEGVGFILWEVLQPYPTDGNPFLKTLVDQPSWSVDFYYSQPGIYKVSATPYESESGYEQGESPLGAAAIFCITVIAG